MSTKPTDPPTPKKGSVIEVRERVEKLLRWKPYITKEAGEKKPAMIYNPKEGEFIERDEVLSIIKEVLHEK